MCRITFIDGKNDMAFDFENAKSAADFIDVARERFSGRDTDDGKSKLVIEMEDIEDDFQEKK